jgi:hypothetical protein
MAVPLFAGCGGGKPQGASMAPVDDTRSSAGAPPAGAGAQPEKTGMSTKKKVVLLAGAAALYYLYQHHKNAQGETVQYYKSKNGRIYYRDKDKRAHYVTAPEQPIQVDESQAQDYSRYRGYNNNTSGEEFGGSNLPPGQD